MSPLPIEENLMAVTANFGGVNYSFPDGTTDDQIYEYLNRQGNAGQSMAEANQSQAPESQDQGYGFGEGGVTGAFKAGEQGAVAGLGHLASAIHPEGGASNNLLSVYNSPFEDPNTSRYASDTAAQFKKESEAGMEKLGTLGKITAGAVEYAPTMALEAVNPVLGTAAMGAQTSGDILGSQYEERGQYNMPEALAGAGVAMAGGRALGALGGKVAALAPEGATGLVPTLQRAAGTVINEGGQGVAFQAGSNVGTGHDVTEGLGEAGVSGLLAGRVMHVAGQSVSKALGIAPNARGQDALVTTKQIEQKTGFQPTDELTNAVYDYHNLSGAHDEAVKSGEIPENTEQVDYALKHGGKAMAADSFQEAADAGVPINEAALNIHIGDNMRGEGNAKPADELFGLERGSAANAGKVIEHAVPTFGNKGTGGQEQGLTKVSHQADFQEKGKTHLANMVSAFDKNTNDIRTALEQAKRDPNATDEHIADLSEMATHAGELQKLALKASGSQTFNEDATIARHANRLMDLAHKTGMTDQLVNTRGEKGAFNPAYDIGKIYTTQRMFHSQMPSFHAGMPDIAKEAFNAHPLKFSTGDLALAGGLGVVAPVLGYGGIVAKKVGKAVVENIRAKRSQKAFGEVQERAGTISQELARIPRTRATEASEALNTGNSGTAAQAADEALKASGINTGDNGIANGPVPTNPFRAAEEVSGTVTPEVAPTAEAERARQAQAVQEAEQAYSKNLSTENYQAASKRRAEQDRYEQVQQDLQSQGEEAVHKAVQDLGGMKALMEKHGYREHDGGLKKIKQDIQAKIRENKAAEAESLRQRNAAKSEVGAPKVEEVSKEMDTHREDTFRKKAELEGFTKEQIDDAVSQGTVNDKFESSVATAALKKHIAPKAPKEVVIKGKSTDEKYLANVDKFQARQKADGNDDYHMQQAAIDAATMPNGEFDMTTANKVMKRLVAMSNEKAPETIKDSAVILAKFVGDAKLIGNEEVQTMMKNATREVKGKHNPPLSVSQMRNLMNKAVNMEKSRILAKRLKEEQALKQAQAQAERAEDKEARAEYMKTVNTHEAAIKGLGQKVKDMESELAIYKAADRAKADTMEAKAKADALDKRMTETEGTVKETIGAFTKIIEKALKGMDDTQKNAVYEYKADEVFNANSKKEMMENAAWFEAASKEPNTTKDHQKYFKEWAKFLPDVVEMMEKHPELPQVRMSREDYETLRDARWNGAHGAAFAGDVGVKVLNMVFGEYKGLVGKPDRLLNRKQIATLLKRKAEGKSLTLPGVEVYVEK